MQSSELSAYLKRCSSPLAYFYIKNKRYAEAISVRHDTYKFIQEIAKAGYASDSNYAATLNAVVKMIEKLTL